MSVEGWHSQVMSRVARGMSVHGIAADLGLPASEIQAVIDSYLDDGPDDDGVAMSPSEIRLRALAIRSGWDADELLDRQRGVQCGGLFG